jgi:hypothetical protein
LRTKTFVLKEHAGGHTSSQSRQNKLCQSAQHEATGNCIYYERRRPEKTILYQLVQEHIETFFAQVKTETGSGLPDFVKDEFDTFLECGILAHGFLRLRCAGIVNFTLNRSNYRHEIY